MDLMDLIMDDAILEYGNERKMLLVPHVGITSVINMGRARLDGATADAERIRALVAGNYQTIDVSNDDNHVILFFNTDDHHHEYHNRAAQALLELYDDAGTTAFTFTRDVLIGAVDEQGDYCGLSPEMINDMTKYLAQIE